MHLKLFTTLSVLFFFASIGFAQDGLINDEFTTDTDGWATVTGGATVGASGGKLHVTMAEVSTGKYRGDIRKTDGAFVDPSTYPILAIKFNKPVTCNLIFDTSEGSFGNGNNKWTGTVGDYIYYYDMANGTFGSEGTIISSLTELTTFQFKVADVTSGETEYDVEWIKTVATVDELYALEPSVGLIDDEFENDKDGWETTTSAATATAADGKLNVAMAEVSTGKYRGDIRRTDGATLYTDNYPILAIKLNKPATCNLILDTSLGSYGNGNNKWTGIAGDDIYYYDLKNGTFGSSATVLDGLTELSTFQFKLADVTSGETEYSVEWVKTVKSIDELYALDPNLGLIDDEFASDADGWEVVTSGASASVANDKLNVSMAISDKNRGDIRKTDGVTLYPGNYPILAIRFNKPATCNVILDTNLGKYGNGNNKWTGIVGTDIYYYDLENGVFGTENTITEPTALTTFQFKIADVTSGETGYSVDWIKTVKTVAELEALVYGHWAENASSNEWGNTANWESGAVPTASDNVTIPAGAAFMPLVTGSAICNNLSIADGANLEVATSGELTINGTITDANTDFSGLTLQYSQTSDAQLMFAGSTNATIVHNLSVNVNTEWQPFATGLTTDVSTGASTATLGASLVGKVYITEYDAINNKYVYSAGALSGEKGYMIYAKASDALTLNGTLSGDAKTYGSLASGFHFLPNHFSTKVDLSQVSLPAENFEQSVWVYNGTDDYNVLDLSSGELEPGSSFFVKASADNSEMSLPIASKTFGASKKGNAEKERILILVNNNSDSDYCTIEINDNATANKDNYDISKLFSIKEDKLSVFSSADANKVTINSVPSGFEGVLPVTVRLNSAGFAQVSLSKENWNSDNTLTVWAGGTATSVGESHTFTLNGNANEEVTFQVEIGKKALSLVKDDQTFGFKAIDNILYLNLDGASSAQLSVFNLQGALIMQRSVSDSSSTVDIIAPAGVYLVKLSASEKQFSQKVFIR